MRKLMKFFNLILYLKSVLSELRSLLRRTDADVTYIYLSHIAASRLVRCNACYVTREIFSTN